MATADPKKPPKKPAARTSPASATAAGPAKPRKSRRLLFWLPLVLLVSGVALAPSIASWTPLGRWIAPRFVAVNGSLELGSLSIGWFSPVAAGNLVLRDADGQAVVELPSATGDKSLAQLIWNRNGLGQFAIDQPAASVVLTATGSNLEEVLAPLLAKSDGSPPIEVGLKVSGGIILVEDRVAQRKYEFRDVACDLQFDGASPAPLNVDASAQWVDGHRSAKLAFTLDGHTLPTPDSPLGAGHLTCQVDRLPLDVLEPLARRRVAGAQLAGWLTTQLDCSWGGGPAHDQTAVAGQVKITDLLLAADAFGQDRIDLARLDAPCRITGTGDTVRIEQLSLDCDLGKASVSGHARLADFAARDVLGALTHEPCQVTGQIDLARLAALLPNTLRIRNGTQISKGDLNIALTSEPQDTGMRWTGSVATSDLEATSDGQQLKWEQPLSVDFQAHDAGEGLVVDKLACTANFLQIEGAGTLDQLTATARCDLNRLAAELDRFVDLHDIVLAGQGQAQLSWRSDAEGHVRGHADVRAREFALVAPGRRPWREASLVLTLDGSGRLDGRTLKHLDTASLKLEAADERLFAQLTAALDDPLAAAWPLQVEWQGDLARLPPRVEPWFDLTGWQLAGRADLQALVALARDECVVQQSKLTVEQLHAWGPGVYVDEPLAEISGNGRWQRAGAKIAVPLASLKGSTLVARLNNVELGLPAAGAQAAGSATLQADLATLARWIHDPRVPATRRISGQFGGQVDLSYDQGTTRAKLVSTIENLLVVEQQVAPEQSPRLFQPAGQQSVTRSWQEPRVTLSARLDYDLGRDELQVTQGELTGQAVRGTLNGRIARLKTTPELDVTGDVQCDWEQIAPLWRPYVGESVQIVGRESWPFSLRGPWTSGATPWLAGAQRMTGQASVKWSSAEFSGLHVSGGTLDGRLADGVLTLVPVGVEVGGGRLTCSPVVRLATQPAQIEIPRGPLLSQVQLTPDICSRALKFVVPVLNEVSRTSGNFSIELDGGHLPLADLGAGDVTGQLLIHSVEMQPGPILQTLLGIAQQIEGVLQAQVPFVNGLRPVAFARMENQTVDFRLVDRRVYHRGLQFQAGNVTISTRGSVGLDESLAVLAEVPLTGSLIGNNQKLAHLNNQTLQIPVEGTLHHPKIDPRSIEKLTALMIQNTAKGLLLNPLEDTLQKLLPAAP